MWLPFAACLIFGVIALSLHHIVGPYVNKVVYLQVPAGMAVPLIFPALRRWAKIRVPFIFEIFIAVQIIISIDIGTALNMYLYIPHYDKFLHTYFGLWCAPLLFYFIGLWGGGSMKEWGKLILVMLGVLGVAAIWEIFEFTMSYVIENYDPQAWHGVAESGGNPMWDTMMDIIVAVIGVAIFYVTFFVDKLFGGRLYGGILCVSSDEDTLVQ